MPTTITSGTQLRCPHCLMPAQTTAVDGEAVVAGHDFPYAVAVYGRCKGSGRQPLPGPATPPPAWGFLEGATFVDIGVLPSPLPTVTRQGWTVTLSGVRFTHTTHCPKCRVCVTTATEGGVLHFGFDQKGVSFEKEHPGARPRFDGECPNGCGHRVVIGGRYSTTTPGMPVAEGRTLQTQQWERLRQELKVWTVRMTGEDLARLRG